jgi:hypothetical protein
MAGAADNTPVFSSHCRAGQEEKSGKEQIHIYVCVFYRHWQIKD